MPKDPRSSTNRMGIWTMAKPSHEHIIIFYAKSQAHVLST